MSNPPQNPTSYIFLIVMTLGDVFAGYKYLKFNDAGREIELADVAVLLAFNVLLAIGWFKTRQKEKAAKKRSPLQP